MFDIGWSELLVVLVVALVVVGPKDLPRLMRALGRWAAKARAMAEQFRSSFDEMARQTELDDLRAEIEALRSERPLAGVEDDIGRSILPPARPKPETAQGEAEDTPKVSVSPGSDPRAP